MAKSHSGSMLKKDKQKNFELESRRKQNFFFFAKRKPNFLIMKIHTFSYITYTASIYVRRSRESHKEKCKPMTKFT